MGIDTVSVWWLLAAFYAGSCITVCLVALINMASYESDRAQMSVDVPGAEAVVDD
jgi:hypothetical protein